MVRHLFLHGSPFRFKQTYPTILLAHCQKRIKKVLMYTLWRWCWPQPIPSKSKMILTIFPTAKKASQTLFSTQVCRIRIASLFNNIILTYILLLSHSCFSNAQSTSFRWFDTYSFMVHASGWNTRIQQYFWPTIRRE